VLPNKVFWKQKKQEYPSKTRDFKNTDGKTLNRFVPVPAIYRLVPVFPANTKTVRVKIEYGTRQNMVFSSIFIPSIMLPPCPGVWVLWGTNVALSGSYSWSSFSSLVRGVKSAHPHASVERCCGVKEP
jgi:hypothetical protein